VVNQSFLPEVRTVPEIESPPLWEAPWFRDVAKLASGVVIIALLLLFVVRPLLRALTAAPKAMVMPAGVLPAMVNSEPAPVEAGASKSAATIAYEQQIAQARSLVAKDPARVAQVVKEWVQRDD
jgi:flagellar M-ring protein FliF